MFTEKAKVHISNLLQQQKRICCLNTQQHTPKLPMPLTGFYRSPSKSLISRSDFKCNVQVILVFDGGEEELGRCINQVPSLSVIFSCYPKQHLDVLLYFPHLTSCKGPTSLSLLDYAQDTQGTLENQNVLQENRGRLGILLHVASLQSPCCLTKNSTMVIRQVKSSTWKI